jgi:hypothetical protein
MEHWKDIIEEEDWASKAWFILLFLMGWEILMFDVMLECLNTFLIKGVDIYFGHNDKVYVINKKTDCKCFWSVCERICKRTERKS